MKQVQFGSAFLKVKGSNPSSSAKKFFFHFQDKLLSQKIPEGYFFRFEIDFHDGPVFAGGLDGDLIGDEAGQERPVGASEQGHGSAASPEQKGRPDVAEKWTRLE